MLCDPTEGRQKRLCSISLAFTYVFIFPSVARLYPLL